MRQFLALLFTILFMLSSSGCGAGQALGPTLTPTLTSTATPTLTPTATATPTATPIPTPSVEAGLHGDNAAQTVYENGTWIVRNAKGEVTATWDEATGLWTYDMERIKIYQKQTSLWDSKDLSPSEDILSRPLPIDDPSTHFIDPATHKPSEYGTFQETTETHISIYIGEFEQPVTYIAVRIRGAVTYGKDNTPVVLLSVPTAVDAESIFAYTPDLSSPQIYGIANEDLVGDL